MRVVDQPAGSTVLTVTWLTVIRTIDPRSSDGSVARGDVERTPS